MGFEPITSRGAGSEVWYRKGQSRRQMMNMLREDHNNTKGRLNYITHEQFDKAIEIIEHYGCKNVKHLFTEAGIHWEKVCAYREKFEDSDDRIESARRSFKANLSAASIDDLRAMMQEDIPVSDRININKFILERMHDDFKPKQEIEGSTDNTLTIVIVDQSQKGEIINVQNAQIRDADECGRIEDDASGVQGLPMPDLQVVDRSHEGGDGDHQEDREGSGGSLPEVPPARDAKKSRWVDGAILLPF